MAAFDIYLEEADTDDERTFLGRMDADTQSNALDLASQYYEHPAHDLIAVQVVGQEPTLRKCPYCGQYHEAHLIERCPRKPKY